MRELPVIKVEKTVKIDKALREKLKELGLLSRLKFLRKELVSCPMKGKEISTANCLVCEHFRRRVRGNIYCTY